VQEQTSPAKRMRRAEGVEERHQDSCATRERDGARCTCRPLFRAYVYNARTKTKVRETFETLTEAKAWRAEHVTKKNRGTLIQPSRETFKQVADAWLAASAAEYKPSTLRGYESDLRTYVNPAFGAHKLADIRRGDWQRFVDDLQAKNLSPSKVRNIVNVARVVYRYALDRELVEINPTLGLKLRGKPGKRMRTLTRAQAEELLAAIPDNPDRSLWACAMFSGLRRGELRGLRWSDIDLTTVPGFIHVRRGWDDLVGEIQPKSEAGLRDVPILPVLRPYLVEWKLESAASPDGFVFGKGDRPFVPWSVRERAMNAWAAANEKRAEQELELLQPIGLHECRHAYASLMLAGGVETKKVSTYMGHSSITITADLYGHLIPGEEAEDAARVDAWMTRGQRDAVGQIEELAKLLSAEDLARAISALQGLTGAVRGGRTK
jgi:integrase